MKVLKRRLKTFFDQDKDINRNENIKKAFKYGYKKTEIANFLNLSTKTINVVLKAKMKQRGMTLFICQSENIGRVKALISI